MLYLYSLVHRFLLFFQSAELVSLKQDVDRHKEMDTAQELKTKWYLNQLNIETETHKVITNDYYQPSLIFKVEQLWVCECINIDVQATWWWVISSFWFFVVFDSLPLTLWINCIFYVLLLWLKNTHTHTHPFNDPLSRTTRVSRYQKGKTNLDFTEARDSEWQWHPLGHMQVCTSLQTDNHASTPQLVFLQAGCPSCRPTNSVKALKAEI